MATKTEDVLPIISLSRQSSSDLSSVPSQTRQTTSFLKADACRTTHQVVQSFSLQYGSLTRFISEPAPLPLKRELERLPPTTPRQFTVPSVPTYQSLGDIGQVMQDADVFGLDAASDSSSAGLSGDTGDGDFLEEGSMITQGILNAMNQCSSSLAVASAGKDCKFMGASSKLAQMTGYSVEELCAVSPASSPVLQHVLSCDSQNEALQQALESGADFTAVLVSQKKDGTHFLNLVHVRGLVLAQSGVSEEEHWISLLAFADVTHMDPKRTPSHHAQRLQKLARRIQKQLLQQLGSEGLDSACDAFDTEWTGMHLTTDVIWRHRTSCQQYAHDMDSALELHQDYINIRSDPDAADIVAHSVQSQSEGPEDMNTFPNDGLCRKSSSPPPELAQNSPQHCLATGFIICKAMGWLRRTLTTATARIRTAFQM